MKRLLFAAFLVFSGNLHAESNGFLTDEEESVIPHRVTDQGIVVVGRDAFERESLVPAHILAHGEIAGKSFLYIEREGLRAFLVPREVVYQAKIMGLGSVYKEVFCASSCVDNALSEAASGMLSGMGEGAAGGAAIGGGAGYIVAGPPGAGAGALVGGGAGAAGGAVIGAVAGAIKGHNQCEKDKAELCDDK